MDLKYRKLISKFKFIHSSARVLMYNSGYFYCLKKFGSKGYDPKLEDYKNSKLNKRCFIIGNGPSLCAEDLDKLIDEDTFAANEIHKIFDKTSWRPTYYMILDRYSKTTPEQLAELDCKNVFVGDYYARFNKIVRDDLTILHQKCFLKKNYFPVSTDLQKYITNSPTVSFGEMQLAAFMGYKEIYLLGFDHNYSFEFDQKGNVISKNSSSAHFFEDEVPSDIIANVYGMTKAYESFKNFCDANHIVVKNVTRGGKLEVYDRADFDSLFSENNS